MCLVRGAGFIITALLSLSVLVSQAKSVDRIAAQTAYLHNDIEGFHQIAIVGLLEGAGVLVLNPNRCRVNEFGDPIVCTLMASTTVDVDIHDTNKSDPAGLGRKLYELKDTGLSNPLLLQVWPDSDRPARLIYNHRGPNSPVPITLEPLLYSEKSTLSSQKAVDLSPAIEPCHGKYTAQQVPNAVLIFATGVHSTAGFQTFFEKLSITVYPPEFRLMHIRPSGPAAQVVSPFAVYTQFSAEEKVDRVVVHDSNGRHEVKVEQVPDTE